MKSKAWAALAGAVTVAAGAASAGEATGLWRVATGGGLIRIERCGQEICGRTVTSPSLQAHPDLTDGRNPDPALRGRPLKGLLILKLHPKGADRWGDGWVYNPRDGRTYNASLTLDGDDRLKITGCLVAPLCQSQTWTRGAGE